VDVSIALIAIAVVLVVAYLIIVIHAATMRRMAGLDEGERPEQALLVWPRWLLALAAALVSFWVLYRVREILLPFIVGAIIAYLLNPGIDRLQRRRVERTPAIGIVFGVFLLIFVGVAVLVLPALTAEAKNLGDHYPAYAEAVKNLVGQARRAAEVWGQLVGLVPTDVRAAFAEVGDRAQTYGLSLLQQSIGLLNRSLVIVSLLIISPIVAYWLLRDYHDIGRKVLLVLPERQREPTRKVLRDINQVAGNYLFGMAIMAGIVAAYACIVLAVAGVPFSVLLGIMTGIFYVIPYVGYPSAVIISGLVMASSGRPLGFILVVLAAMVAGNVISDYILYPRIVGHRVGVHPLVVIFAILAGGTLFGFLGVIIAVPLAGVIKVISLHFWPELFQAEPADAAETP
jgi:predicted PurR-regulated permease PerM